MAKCGAGPDLFCGPAPANGGTCAKEEWDLRHREAKGPAPPRGQGAWATEKPGNLRYANRTGTSNTLISEFYNCWKLVIIERRFRMLIVGKCCAAKFLPPASSLGAGIWLTDEEKSDNIARDKATNVSSSQDSTRQAIYETSDRQFPLP